MLDSQAREAIARLAASMLSVKPLAEVLAPPIRVVPVAPDTVGPPANWPATHWRTLDELLERVARQAGVAGLTLSQDVALDDLQVFERVISNRLAIAALAESVTVPEALLTEIDVDKIAAEAVADSFDVFFQKEVIAALDGVPLSVYCAGQGSEAVVVVPACGMPAALAEDWMRFLARDRLVLAWESRGLFGVADYHDDYAVDLGAQAEDLFTVMDHFGISKAHVVGLCGGAVIALAAAASQPGRICSLSLWHGAYEFASGSPKTRFQHDLVELMAIAAHSRAAARSVQTAFCQVALTSVPAELAHYVLYPYADPGLLYQYCRVNHSLASTDVSQYLAKVEQPTLVVTSHDDQTAHPQGSRQVADGLRNALLRVEPRGDHSTLFQADSTMMQVAVDFIAQLLPTPGSLSDRASVSAD
jgi:3-oxoadipate enol-lactonase